MRRGSNIEAVEWQPHRLLPRTPRPMMVATYRCDMPEAERQQVRMMIERLAPGMLETLPQDVEVREVTP